MNLIEVESMNVLVIPTWYPNGTDKLMGIYHKEFCHALSKCDDISVNMLYIDRQGIKNIFKYVMMNKREVEKEDGYNVFIRKMLDTHKISANWQLKRYTKALERAYLEYIKENPKPDIIHAEVTIPAGYAASVLGEKYNIPVVVTEHATYYERFFKGINEPFGKYVLEHSYFTTVSSYMQKEILKMNYKCDVLPNLVDTENFKKKRTPIKGLRLVTVVSLRKVKRVDDIIASLKLLIEEKGVSDAELTVVGDGFDEDYYKRVCHELNMDAYVHFLGRKTKSEIADILLENNIYVMSSEIETFGIPAIEALASGLPVVATRSLGPEEYINDKCGKLVEVGNIEEMSRAIMEVYENLDSYKVEDLRKQADKYSAETISKKAIKIYRKLLSKR